jgi:hypothetical protein
MSFQVLKVIRKIPKITYTYLRNVHRKKGTKIRVSNFSKKVDHSFVEFAREKTWSVAALLNRSRRNRVKFHIQKIPQNASRNSRVVPLTSPKGAAVSTHSPSKVIIEISCLCTCLPGLPDGLFSNRESQFG